MIHLILYIKYSYIDDILGLVPYEFLYSTTQIPRHEGNLDPFTPETGSGIVNPTEHGTDTEGTLKDLRGYYRPYQVPTITVGQSHRTWTQPCTYPEAEEKRKTFINLERWCVLSNWSIGLLDTLNVDTIVGSQGTDLSLRS